MTTRISFPSTEFPATVSLGVDVPSAWQGRPTSGTVLAVFKPNDDGAFTPNVVATVARFAAGYAVDSAVEAVLKNVNEIADVEILGQEKREIAGLPGFRIEFSFTDSRVGTLVQAVRVVAVPNGPVVDLVTITATATASQAQTLWGELRAIQESLTLDA